MTLRGVPLHAPLPVEPGTTLDPTPGPAPVQCRGCALVVTFDTKCTWWKCGHCDWTCTMEVHDLRSWWRRVLWRIGF